MGEVIKRKSGYYLRYYEGGRRRIIASKQPTLAEARRMLLEIEARIARGDVGIDERRQVGSLGELVDRFLAEYSRPAIKDIGRYRRYARAALKRAKALFARQADQVTAADVARLREALRSDYAPASVKLTMHFLSTALNWAIREGIVRRNPCVGVERPVVSSSVEFLSREEVRRLIHGAEAESRTMIGRMRYLAIRLGLHTGMRKGELIGLRWTDIDLETRRLTVARSFRRIPKGGRARHLRLPVGLVQPFEEWRRDCPSSLDGVVFPIGKLGKTPADHAMLGLSVLWQKLGLRAVPRNRIWHILRHTFASHFIMAGGNIMALQKILGHSDLKMTLMYAHLAPDFLEGEMERVRY